MYHNIKTSLVDYTNRLVFIFLLSSYLLILVYYLQPEVLFPGGIGEPPTILEGQGISEHP